MPDFGHRKSRSVDRLKIGALIERTAIVQARTQFSRALEAYRRGGALKQTKRAGRHATSGSSRRFAGAEKAGPRTGFWLTHSWLVAR